jgi:putative membrane protein
MSISPNWEPYCGAAPVPRDWYARWNLDPWFFAAMAGAVLAWWLLRSGDRRKERSAALALGCVVFLFVSPFCALSSALFTARVVHHVLLATVLAPLLALSLPARRDAVPGSLTVWTGLQGALLWIWHAPPLYAAALSSDAVFWAMQVTITASAAVWWLKVLRAPAAASVAALLGAMVLMGVLGALITFAGRPLYAPHWLTTQPWGLSPLEDQQIAGIIMWAPASAIYLITAMVILHRSLDETRPAR